MDGRTAGRGTGASRALRVFSKKLFGRGGVHVSHDWGASRADDRLPGTCWGAGRAIAGWVGARGASALAGQGRRAGSWRFDRARPEAFGGPCGGCAEGPGTNGGKRSTSRSRRNRSGGRGRSSRFRGIQAWVTRVTQIVYTRRVRKARRADASAGTCVADFRSGRWSSGLRCGL